MSEERIQLQPELTGLALAYQNKTCIADKIFPKVPVNSTVFTYQEYRTSDILALPETRIGEAGEPSRIELFGQEKTAKTEDHALEAVISVAKEKEYQRNNSKVNLEALKTTQLVSVLQARKEVEFSKLLSDSNQYGGNAKTLGNDEKISKAEVDAFNLIGDAIDEVFYKPNKMVISRKALSKLRRNPSIIDAANRSDERKGAVSLEALKEIFELDEILVGETMVDTSKNKKQPQLEACWGNDIVLMHVNDLATNEFGVTFGFDAVYDDVTIASYDDGRPGKEGAKILKAFMSHKNLIVCPRCGYLLKDVI